jgi:hypothetical protein
VDKGLAARKLRFALDMYEMGETFVRQRLRRQHPQASPTEIEEKVWAWRTGRPGGGPWRLVRSSVPPSRMNPVEQVLRRVASQLAASGQGWALVGGFAVSVRADPRFTRYVDVAVAVSDDAHAEHMIRSLVAAGYRATTLVEQVATGRLATARMVTSDDPDEVIVDLLFASSGIEPEIVAAADRIEIAPGLIVPVAQTGHLIAAKLLAREDECRPLDLADLRALLAVAGPADLVVAREAVGLISERGFHRDRDLAAGLAELLS